MKKILGVLILPKRISDFERKYLARVNRISLWFFLMHVPVMIVIAWLNQTRPGSAALLSAAVVAGPTVAYFAIKNPRTLSIVYGITAMFMGGLLVHFGQGPMQIEMHFYFFSLLAMCVVFGNPMVIVAAAVTVALHHLVVWLALPISVFNYDASVWVVAVHASFVVLESIAACFIARSFFDNVIELELVVQARTAALDARNQDMRLLLDNVQQGFVTIDREGRLSQQRSAAVDRWFGAQLRGGNWFDFLELISPAVAAQTRLSFDEVIEGVMPIELTIDQMPHRLVVGETHYRIDYRPIGDHEPHAQFLVIVTDVTADVAREHAELERRESMAVFERVLVDRSGFEAFFEEGSSIVDVLVKGGSSDERLVRRLLHTLKGNASIQGLHSVAAICHGLEDVIAETHVLPPPSACDQLAERWARLTSDIEKLLGQRAHCIEIDEPHYAALFAAVAGGEPKDALLRRVGDLKREPTAKRLQRFAEQAQRIARRLEKSINVRIEDHDVCLDSRNWAGFWGTFIHAVRNALDHGIETPEERIAAGKPAEGTIIFRTVEERDNLVIEIADDGRGIDWPAVKARAAIAGLPVTTAEELQRAVFADGVTTAAKVTDLSGRGIGLSALLHGTAERGGSVTIDSSPAGTLVRMAFPLLSADRDMRAA